MTTKNTSRLPDENPFRIPTDNCPEDMRDEIERVGSLLQAALDKFKVKGRVVHAVCGPQAIRYEIQLDTKAAAKRLSRLRDTLSMTLGTARPVRILLPSSDTAPAGVEVPRRCRQTVTAQEVFNDTVWLDTRCEVPLMLGRDIEGKCVVIDLAKAPHLLMAGTTGSGKSGLMSLMLHSMLLKFPPDELKLILFDPKYLEFQPYGTLPHLLMPVINEPKQLPRALRRAIGEMDRRYALLSRARVKKLSEFNARPADPPDMTDADGKPLPRKLPRIVIVIDELADIMAVARKETETALDILAARSRAAGIHIIAATQRPDTHVVTGSLKNNFPCRIALQMTDTISSKMVIGQQGGESLLGQGDMLLRRGGDINRIQGGWVPAEEVAAIVEACARRWPQRFDPAWQV